MIFIIILCCYAEDPVKGNIYFVLILKYKIDI